MSDWSEPQPIGGPILKYTAEGLDQQFGTEHYDGDVGYDLQYQGERPLVVWPLKITNIPTGIAIEPPIGCWALIVGRSSTFQRGLLVNPGIIDWGWRGELLVCAVNITQNTVEIQPGERIGQLILAPIIRPQAWRVSELGPSERGTNGFGSTGG